MFSGERELKKFLLIIFILSWNIFNLTAIDYQHEVEVGVSLHLDETTKLSENKSIDYLSCLTPRFSYELMFKNIPNFDYSFSSGSSILIDPVNNVYSISAYLKAFLSNDNSGFFFGIMPLYDLNFGLLIADIGNINYAFGFLLGFNEFFSEQFLFSSQVNLGFAFFSSCLFKADLNINLGYIIN